MFSAEERCWVVEERHDMWMWPLRVTDERTKKWEEDAQGTVIRGRDCSRRLLKLLL